MVPIKYFHVNNSHCPNVNRHLGPPPNRHLSPSPPFLQTTSSMAKGVGTPSFHRLSSFVGPCFI